MINFKQFIEKQKTKRLCSLVSKELENNGYRAWPVEMPDSKLNLGVTLPDEIKTNTEAELRKFNETIRGIEKKYSNKIKYTNPIFSAGGVYATYLQIISN